MALGPDGSIWTAMSSSIGHVSGLSTLAGGLDNRVRPRHAPDFVEGYAFYSRLWTNVTANTNPTFAGVARPGADVTLWVQKRGANHPVSIGTVHANRTDGSWTLKSHVRLSDGHYAVTATQSGDTGPPSVLYSLDPDSNGDLSDALVIGAPRARREKGG